MDFEDEAASYLRRYVSFRWLFWKASVADVDFVVSWNFKHIVHYEKISGYQAVNLMGGYKEIRIYSPRELVESEEE